MHQILIAGAGTIGKTVAQWLSNSGDYNIHLIDIAKPEEFSNQSIQSIQMDISNKEELKKYVEKNAIEAIVSTLPFFFNIELAVFAQQHSIHYFDPTEDIEVTNTIKKLTTKNDAAFVPQCGLAPGYIDIIANSYIQDFDQVSKVKLRCGALPQNSSHALHYAFTWSPDGLINEYINKCEVLHNSELTHANALEGLESIEIDGNTYEAFHTSGGLATLAQTYQHKVESMDYKTIRYPGHAEKMNFLLNDLNLRNDRNNLQNILTKVIPYTNQDVVLIYVSVSGMINSRLEKKSFAHKYYPQKAFGVNCSAIQLTTTSGLCTAIDIVLNNPEKYKGFIKQEQFSLQEFYNNRFGQPLLPVEQKEAV